MAEDGSAVAMAEEERRCLLLWETVDKEAKSRVSRYSAGSTHSCTSKHPYAQA